MIQKVADLLLMCGGPRSVLPPTQLFNEGWLLRLTLDWFATTGTQGHPFSMQPGARWYSEALLPSQFLPRFRGDNLAESWTHADAVVGHFRIGEEQGGAAILEAEASQFVVIEAKLMSPLSKGTKYSPDFDQAARNVACVAEVLARSGRRPDAMKTIGFHLVAPQAQRDAGIFGDLLTKPSISSKVQRRIASYQKWPEANGEKTEWLADWFLPTLERSRIEFVSWESIATFISSADPPTGSAYREFYRRCLHFNGRRTERSG